MITELEPRVLQWARSRAYLDIPKLAKKVNVKPEAVMAWEKTGRISFENAQVLADETHTPFGFLFLPEPPKETLPVSDFRTIGNRPERPPSPDLLEVIHQAQLRQNWYREYQIRRGIPPVAFVGSVTISDSVVDTALKIRQRIKFDFIRESEVNDFESAIRLCVESIEESGILFNRTGIADGNTHRKLSVDEFRGFALADQYAPLVFVNGADAKTAQFFTMAHEVAHIWLGQSAVSNLDKTFSSNSEIERFCNAVAAEVLLSFSDLRKEWRASASASGEISRIAEKYKLSKVVVARRAFDSDKISYEQYQNIYTREASKIKKPSGGDWYVNRQYENSRRFSVGIIRDTKEGNTLYRDAMRLLGVNKTEKFEKYVAKLGL